MNLIPIKKLSNQI